MNAQPRDEGSPVTPVAARTAMPSAHHQAGAYSLHDQPDVALGLLEATGVELPEHDTMHIDSPKLPST